MSAPRTVAKPRAVLSADARLQHMRDAFVDIVLKGVFWLTLCILALVTWRAVMFPLPTGWHLSGGIMAGLTLLFYPVYFLRKRLSYAVKAGVLIVVFVAGGCAALPTVGFAGGGSGTWIVSGCFIAAVIFPRRVAIAAIVFCTLCLGVAAVAYVSGWHTTPVNLNIMLVQPAAWINVMVSIAATTGIITLAMNAYSRSIRALLQDVDRQQAQIEHLATHDTLTGLPLLAMAVDRCDMALHHAQRTQQKVALLFIDLDRFKAVNDAFGHEAGDHVLREVAARMKANVRATDTAARIGGDEFMVVLTALDNAEFAADVAEKLVTALSLPIAYQEHALQIGASIGIGVFPDHAHDTVALRKVSDAAMYRVKRSGKNGFAFAVAA